MTLSKQKEVRTMRYSNDENLSIDGTSLQGMMQATLAQMIHAFGQPTLGEEGDRVLARWVIQTYEGVTITFYCWKLQQLPAPDEVISWHIGGCKEKAREIGHQLFRHAHGLLAASS
jgi:hypothetical protein